MVRTRVLIAGLAGASLGTEVLKSLECVEGKYDIYGCDIAPLAYGLYSPMLKKSFVVNRNEYVMDLVKICLENEIKFIIPGAEQPMVILGNHLEVLTKNGITLVGNSSEIISLFSNKEKAFNYLKSIGVSIPFTKRIKSINDLQDLFFPCIVKPSSGTGGSDSVFLASNLEECTMFVNLLLSNKREIIIQEYIDLNEGEFTIGVLSDRQSNVIGSVAMQRIFDSKLSVSYRGTSGLISSGYSQGLIADFPELRRQAEAIALKCGSKGPLNIQGRVRNGVFFPFEINPRFSASTYLRNMAGFNEIDIFLNYLTSGNANYEGKIHDGYYLRTFSEMFVPIDKVKKSIKQN